MLPQHVVIVAVDLEQRLELVDVVPQGEDPFEVAHTRQFFLGLEQHHPVLRAQDLQAVVEAKLLQVVRVL